MDISFSLCFSVFCYGLTLHLESVKKKNPTAIVFTNGTDETCTTKSQGMRRWEGHVSSLHKLQFHILELQKSLSIFKILYPKCTEDILGWTNRRISSSQTKTLFSILGAACRPQNCGLLYKINTLPTILEYKNETLHDDT